MVIEVFVAQGNCENALGKHGSLLMNNKDLITRIWYAAIDGIDKPEMLIHLTQKQCARVGSEAAAVEISVDFLVFLISKKQWLPVTVCHKNGLSAGVWLLL